MADNSHIVHQLARALNILSFFERNSTIERRCIVWLVIYKNFGFPGKTRRRDPQHCGDRQIKTARRPPRVRIRETDSVRIFFFNLSIEFHVENQFFFPILLFVSTFFKFCCKKNKMTGWKSVQVIARKYSRSTRTRSP